MRSNTSVRPFQKIKLEDIKIGDEISLHVENYCLFPNSIIYNIFEYKLEDKVFAYDFYILNESKQCVVNVNKTITNDIRAYKHYDRNHDFENEKSETEKHSDFYQQLKVFALKQNSAVVKVYYKSPLCDKDYSIKDIKITRGVIENMNATSVYIKNENSVIEVFKFSDIIQMIEI